MPNVMQVDKSLLSLIYMYIRFGKLNVRRLKQRQIALISSLK